MALGGAVTAGSTVAAGATTGLLQAGRGGLATAQGLLGASRGAQLALTMTQGAAPMTRTLTALSAARSGAQTAIQQSPLVVRLGSLAGAQQQRARQQGGQSLRQLVDMSRYSGHDHGGYGVRR
jgi:hypothetical protein